jgi:hypothetical protein
VCVRGAWSGGAGGATGSDEGEDSAVATGSDEGEDSAVGEEGRVEEVV